MKINTKLRYGLRMVTTIAAKNRLINTTAMGKEMAVSPKYLRKLLGPLERSGIVKSVQGIYGGFLLNKEPREITIQMIADAYGEKLNLTDCLRGKRCPLLATCLTRPVWERLLRSISQQFVGTTIQDILDGAVAKE